MPMETDPIERYEVPRMVATARPARMNFRIFSLTSLGMEVSLLSWTSLP